MQLSPFSQYHYHDFVAQMAELLQICLPNPQPSQLHLPINNPKTATTFSTSTTPPPPISLKKPHLKSTAPSFSATNTASTFLFLESLGVDVLRATAAHPQIASTPVPSLQSVVQFLDESIGLHHSEYSRLFNVCPEILTSDVQASLLPVVTFLLREVRIPLRYLPRAIHRRPRLLACSVDRRLRPTLYFLQSLGIEQVWKHSSLLSSDAEEKYVPRLEFLVGEAGLSQRDAVQMVRRFPQLFCYGIESNLRVKLEYLVNEMRRDVEEARDFPHYFSFSLENRIIPRHKESVERNVRLPLHVMLKGSDRGFREKIEVCLGSSWPSRNSPLRDKYSSCSSP